MSKSASNLKHAIHTLNIKKPYDLRGQNSPKLKPPVQIEHSRNEATQIEQTQKRQAPQGFFMLAHSIFENEVVRQLPGDAFRIFIWVSAQAWRFKESNGEFRGAVGFISAGCGCSKSTVSRGLQDLKKMKLIECVEQNFKRGNLWRTSRIADGRNTLLENSQNEVSQGVQGHIEHGASPNSDCSMVNLTKEDGQFDHEIINSNNFKKTQHSSGTVSSEVILNYLEGIASDKKRDSERMALLTLQQSFELVEIEIALSFLADQKFNFKGTSIHSPLAFLTYAMNEVLTSTKHNRAKNELKITHLRNAQSDSIKASTDLQNIQQETATMVAEFISAFPSENVLEMKVGELVGGLPFKSKDQRVSYAAQKWWLHREGEGANV